MKFPKRPRTFMIVGMIVLLAGIVSLQVLREEPIDLSKEEAPFPSIKMPPQAVYGFGYMDGGSVGIQVVDGSGAKHEFTFPIDYHGIRNAHPTAFFGNINDPKKIALKNPERAKEIIIQLLDQFGKEMDYPSVDSNDHTARARLALSSPPVVVAIRLFEKARRVLDY